MIESALMVGLGEVLWDLLPGGRTLGGAPSNFAYMTCALGDRGVVASRVGIDSLGEATRQEMEKLGLSIAFLQQDTDLQTGTASVTIDSAGQPTFTIAGPVAWDRLEWTIEWEELSSNADVVCFGSLAQRSDGSRGTIERFLRNSKPNALRIFDINLRQSYYCEETLRRSLQHATIVKVTEQELLRLASLFRWEASTDQIRAGRLLCEWKLKLVCVTRGSRGSLLVSESEIVDHPGFPVKVVDAVGAGDAFTACLAHCYVRERSLAEISEYANRFASFVATQTGATPRIDPLRTRQLLSGRAVWPPSQEREPV